MQPSGLSGIPLFSTLPAQEISHLEASLPVVSFPAGEILLREGESDNKFYILMEGQVEAVKELDGSEERILGRRGAGSLLGEMSLFSQNGCHTASVRSLTPVQLLKVTRVDLDALLHRQPQLAYEIVRLLSKRLEESENGTILDLREKNQRLEEAYEALKAAQAQIIEQERLQKELEIARHIQESILPVELPVVPGYEFGALMIPARMVGGDFYTFFHLDNEHLGIVVGDVSDKGVPAALFMALTFSLMRAEAMRTSSPVEAFRKVNENLLEMNSSGMFVTLIYGILDLPSGNFHYARAGHLPPYLLDKEGRPVEMPFSAGQPLGLFDNLPIDEQHIQLAPGGMLLLYSDGVSETMDTRGNQFGFDLLYRTLTAARPSSAQSVCEQLWQDVQVHGEHQPQQDDFTTVVIKRSIEA